MLHLEFIITVGECRIMTLTYQSPTDNRRAIDKNTQLWFHLNTDIVRAQQTQTQAPVINTREHIVSMGGCLWKSNPGSITLPLCQLVMPLSSFKTELNEKSAVCLFRPSNQYQTLYWLMAMYAYVM